MIAMVKFFVVKMSFNAEARVFPRPLLALNSPISRFE